jgi:hypothetical protein
MFVIFWRGILVLADQDDDGISPRNMPKPDSRNVEADLLG